MSDLTFVQGDTAPSVSGTLLQPGTTTPFDLSQADEVRFQMRLATDRRWAVDAAATIVDANAGTVLYDWADGDLAVAGDYSARWQIAFNDGTIQHTDLPNTITVSPQ